MKQAAVSEQIVVTAAAPLIETARTEGATRIDQKSVEGLPNNGRNFLDYTKLTPGVTIVQGPDGDELSINGQKGIPNNISVDGADFNNPFFGEQRGGQRPAFTFNLDAVKEMVVIADGANAEFGRSTSGFVNVITKSGTNDMNGTAHLVFKNDALSSNAEEPQRHHGAEVQTASVPDRLHARRTDHARSALLLRGRRFPERPTPRSRRTRPASSSASWPRSRRSGAPVRTSRSSARTTRASSSGKWTGISRRRTWPRSATTTRGRSRRTARSTSTPGAAARTPTEKDSRTPSPVRSSRRSRTTC